MQGRLEIIAPACRNEEIADVWSPGDNIALRGVATLSDQFWIETGIDKGDDVRLVAVATCAPARIRWRANSRFEASEEGWTAFVDLTANGSDIAVSLTADLWVVGPGRTGSAVQENAVHGSAKLWQLATPLILALEHDDAEFPTSALSFSQTGRRAVPWVVETVPDAEPHWSISSSVRLFVNTDMEVCHPILEGTAGASTYAAIECDIHMAVLRLLGSWQNVVDGRGILALADDDFRCIAALGLGITTSLGITIEEGCRLAMEEPLKLADRSREALNFLQEQDPR
ncbi:hypothetical protein DT073_12795 [Microbacterium sp. ABRD28]|nr:hypothetical protein DT073_12795 [Microbacterium sp. ABRD28]